MAIGGFKYHLGDAVNKRKGYSFPGEVVSAFVTSSGGVTRYVVESTVLPGLLHIYSEDDLVRTSAQHGYPRSTPLPETD